MPDYALCEVCDLVSEQPCSVMQGLGLRSNHFSHQLSPLNDRLWAAQRHECPPPISWSLSRTAFYLTMAHSDLPDHNSSNTPCRYSFPPKAPAPAGNRWKKQPLSNHNPCPASRPRPPDRPSPFESLYSVRRIPPSSPACHDE